MAELRQLHIVIPEDGEGSPVGEYRSPRTEVSGGEVTVDARFEDAFDLMHFAVPSDVEQLGDTSNIWISSQLFEEREDNLDKVQYIHEQLTKCYPDADIFRSQIDRSFGGGSRSITDPDAHIILSVENWGVSEPHLSWWRQVDHLDAPPTTNGERIFHADREGIYALNGDTGDTRWKTKVSDVIRVPIATDEYVIGSGRWFIIALDSSSGEVEWRVDLDRTEGNSIDSRVVTDGDIVYAGLRNGQVRRVSMDDGSCSLLKEFEDSVVRLNAGEEYFVVGTGGELHIESRNDGVSWSRSLERLSLVRYVLGEETVYLATGDGLFAMDIDSQSTHWKTDLRDCKSLYLTDDMIFVNTARNVVGVDRHDGSIEWEVDSAEGVSDYSAVDYTGEHAVMMEFKFRSGANLSHVFETTLQFREPSTGRVVKSLDVGYGKYQTPVVGSDSVVLAGNGGIWCIDGLEVL